MWKRPDSRVIVTGFGNGTDLSIRLISEEDVVAEALEEAETGSDNRVSITKGPDSQVNGTTKGPDSQVNGTSKDPDFEMDDNIKTISSCNLADVLANLFNALSSTLKSFSFSLSFLSLPLFLSHMVSSALLLVLSSNFLVALACVI